MSRAARSLVLASMLLLGTAGAQEKGEHSLADLSIEDLMNESVTSVAKKASRLVDAPTAISVITQDDIRRSGYTSIPELLRLVPGIQVARIDGNEWAISARGFNAQYANKLLVLMDGQTVYTSSSGGVYWNVQDTPLEDIERIEVIRGPGATLWGTNAVNGVINIITRNSRDTQGALVSASTGTLEDGLVTARYGGQLGSEVHYRVYGQYVDREPLVDADGRDASDSLDAQRGGFRLDWQGALDSATLEADHYDTQAQKPVTFTTLQPPYFVDEVIKPQDHGDSAIASWVHTFSPSSQLDVHVDWQRFKQSYGFGTEYQDSYDLEIQHHVGLGSRNDVVWGLGYRNSTLQETPTSTLVWTPETVRLPLYSTFVQDEISLVPERWRVVLGTKLEHNPLTGLEVQPSARLLWTPTAATTLWGAFSRATRIPALFERDSELKVGVIPSLAGPPIWVELFGNPNVDEEKLLAYELGLRVQPTEALSVDLAAFYDVYHDLIDYTSNTPVFALAPTPHILVSSTESNADSAQSYGAEISVQWRVLSNWRLSGSYSGLRVHVRPDVPLEGSSPKHQVQLRSYLDLPGRVEVNTALMYVDAISFVPATTLVRIPSYVRADLGITWRPAAKWQLGVWGQNLLQARHAEFPSLQTPIQTEIPRSVLGRVVWEF
jgi:iron complex outermembrane recepter protein